MDPGTSPIPKKDHDPEYTTTQSSADPSSTTGTSQETRSLDFAARKYKNMKYIVEYEKLDELFDLVTCNVGRCRAPIVHSETRTRGIALCKKWICEAGHQRTWESQSFYQRERLETKPRTEKMDIRGQPEGHLESSAAIVSTGATHGTIADWARVSRIQFYTDRTHSKIQGSYLVPAADELWEEVKFCRIYCKVLSCRSRPHDWAA